MNHLLYIFPVIILRPLIRIIYSYKHFLMCLLLLEAITLRAIIIITILILNHSYVETLNIILILSFGACEASLGLSCLIKIIRSHGNDNIKTLNIKY